MKSQPHQDASFALQAAADKEQELYAELPAPAGQGVPAERGWGMTS